MDDLLRRHDLDQFRAEVKHDLAAMETRLMTMNIATALAVAGLVLAAVKLA